MNFRSVIQFTLLLSAVGLAAYFAGCVTMPKGGITLDDSTRTRAVNVLRSGMKADDFWPSIHAAEGLTLGGYGREVRAHLEPKLETETDDQHRCGLARELVRTGQTDRVNILAEILAGSDPHGHVHAAESLYKVNEVGDPKAMRRAFEQDANIKLKLMAAAALARHGDLDAVKFIRDSVRTGTGESLRISAWIIGRIGNNSDIEPLRARLPDAGTPILRAYIEHALAALGDPDGLVALGRNLDSSNPEIRTYAATWAGDARAGHLEGKLKKMLSDSHLDARIRAAQTLLVLAK